MKSINPAAKNVKQLATTVPPDVPVVMLNLLRFRAMADYSPSHAQPARSGREAYAEYGREIQPYLEQVGGRIIWQGEAHCAFIAPQGEEWDEVLLVSYPSKDAFLAMLKSPGYQSMTFHRTAALEDARLIVTVETPK